MKQCPNCGAQIADGSKFCTECGKPIPQGHFCPHCGASVYEGDNFCQSCGKNVHEEPNLPTYEEGESKSGFKKFLLYALGAFVVLAIIGFFSSIDSDDSSNSPNEEVQTTDVAESNTIISETDYSEDDEESQKNPNEDYSWLQGHWVYEQGSYKGHIIIQGDKIIQYTSTNPERDETTFIIEGDELRSKLIDGMYLVVPIDYANHTIDYGEGQWMHKISSSSDDNNFSSSNTSSSSNSTPSRTFYDEAIIVGFLANQTFRSSDGFTIRFDGDGRMFAEGQYAGVVSVLSYNSTSALLKYSGGISSEGNIKVKIVGNKFQLTDPIDGTVYYQR